MVDVREGQMVDVGKGQIVDLEAWLALVSWEHFDEENHFHKEHNYIDLVNEHRKLVYKVIGRGDIDVPRIEKLTLSDYYGFAFLGNYDADFDMTIEEEQKLSDFYKLADRYALIHHKKTN